MDWAGWIAPLVIVGAVLVSAGSFAVCMSIPKLGEWISDLFHRD